MQTSYTVVLVFKLKMCIVVYDNYKNVHKPNNFFRKENEYGELPDYLFNRGYITLLDRNQVSICVLLA